MILELVKLIKGNGVWECDQRSKNEKIGNDLRAVLRRKNPQKQNNPNDRDGTKTK